MGARIYLRLYDRGTQVLVLWSGCLLCNVAYQGLIPGIPYRNLNLTRNKPWAKLDVAQTNKTKDNKAHHTILHFSLQKCQEFYFYNPSELYKAYYIS